jgi:predicted amidophosphoribosyltransferase
MADRQPEFAWPPAPPTDQPPARQVPASSPVPTKRVGGVWHAIESAWLGSAGVALGHRGNWTPEPMGAACPRCGRSVGPGEVSADDGRCPGCRPEKLRWEQTIRLGEFDGDLRKAVLETKYGAWRAQGTLLGRLLGERIAHRLAEAQIEPDDAVIVPAPMPWLRRMRRGIDHAMVLARGASSTSGCRLEPVLRRRAGPKQTAVPASARATNIRRQITAARPVAAETRAIIVVDDVRTTGATLDACCRSLTLTTENAPWIWAAVVAAAGEPGRRLAASRGHPNG